MRLTFTVNVIGVFSMCIALIGFRLFPVKIIIGLGKQIMIVVPCIYSSVKASAVDCRRAVQIMRCFADQVPVLIPFAFRFSNLGK